MIEHWSVVVWVSGQLKLSSFMLLSQSSKKSATVAYWALTTTMISGSIIFPLGIFWAAKTKKSCGQAKWNSPNLSHHKSPDPKTYCSENGHRFWVPADTNLTTTGSFHEHLGGVGISAVGLGLFHPLLPTWVGMLIQNKKLAINSVLVVGSIRSGSLCRWPYTVVQCGNRLLNRLVCRWSTGPLAKAKVHQSCISDLCGATDRWSLVTWSFITALLIFLHLNCPLWKTVVEKSCGLWRSPHTHFITQS